MVAPIKYDRSGSSQLNAAAMPPTPVIIATTGVMQQSDVANAAYDDWVGPEE